MMRGEWEESTSWIPAVKDSKRKRPRKTRNSSGGGSSYGSLDGYVERTLRKRKKKAGPAVIETIVLDDDSQSESGSPTKASQEQARSNSTGFTRCVAFLTSEGGCHAPEFFAWFQSQRVGTATWPKEKHIESGEVPFKIALEHHAPRNVVTAIRGITPPFLVCVAYLKHLDGNGSELFSWMSSRLGGAWIKSKAVRFENDYDNLIENGTLLLLALCSKASEAILLALLNAWPDAPKHLATINYCPEYALAASRFNYRTLLSVDGRGVEDPEGNVDGTVLALHFALRYRAAPAVVHALLNVWSVKPMNYPNPQLLFIFCMLLAFYYADISPPPHIHHHS